MDSSTSHSERHYKKIIIPDGSITPDETVIIEVPAEFQSNRTFLSTRGNLNQTFPATKLRNVTGVLNQTRPINTDTNNPNATFSNRNLSRSDPGKTHGSLNNPQESQNSPNSCCAPPTASTSNQSPVYSTQYNKPTTNYSLNATSTLHRSEARQSNTVDPSSPSLAHLNTLYDPSKQNTDESLMGKILRGEDCCRSSENAKITSQYTDSLDSTRQSNYSRFVPSAQSTLVTSKHELSNYLEKLPTKRRPHINTKQTDGSRFAPQVESTAITSKSNNSRSPQYLTKNIIENNTAEELWKKPKSKNLTNATHQVSFPQKTNQTINYSQFTPSVQNTPITSPYTEFSPTLSPPQNVTISSYTTEESCDCDEEKPETVSSFQGLNLTADYSRFAPPAQSTKIQRYGGSSQMRSPPTPFSLQESKSIRSPGTTYQVTSPQTLHQTANYSKFAPPVQSTKISKYEESSPTHSSGQNSTMSSTSPRGLNQTANYSRFTPPVQSTPITSRHREYATTRSLPQNSTRSNNITDKSCDCDKEDFESVRSPTSSYQTSSLQGFNLTTNYSKFAPPVQSTPVTSRCAGYTTITTSLEHSSLQNGTKSNNISNESCDCGEEMLESVGLQNTTYQVNSPQGLNQTGNYSRFVPPVQSTPIKSTYKASFPQNSTMNNNTTEKSCDCGEEETEGTVRSPNTTYQVSSPQGLSQTVNYSKLAPPVQSTLVTSRYKGSSPTRSFLQNSTINSNTTEESCYCSGEETESIRSPNTTYQVSSSQGLNQTASYLRGTPPVQSTPSQKSTLDRTTDYSRLAPSTQRTPTTSKSLPSRSLPTRSPISNYSVEESRQRGQDQYESLPNTTYQVSSPQKRNQTVNYSKFTSPVRSTQIANKFEGSLPSTFFPQTSTMSNYSTKESCDCYADESEVNSQSRTPKKGAINRTVNYSKFFPSGQSTPITSKGTKLNYNQSLPAECLPQNATYTVTSGNTTEESCFCGDETESVNTETYTIEGNYSDTSGSQNPYNFTPSTLNNSSKRVKFEKTSSTVRTYTEESERLGDEPKVIRTTSKIETTATEIHPSEISISETRSTPSRQSSRGNISGETVSGETINLNDLRQLEEQERTQLAEDLRRMQEARRQLALHATSIGGSTNFL